MYMRKPHASTEESRFKVKPESRDSNPRPTKQPSTRKPTIASSTTSSPRPLLRRNSEPSVIEKQNPNLNARHSKFQHNHRIPDQRVPGLKVSESPKAHVKDVNQRALQKRRASKPGLKVSEHNDAQHTRRTADLGVLFPTQPGPNATKQRSVSDVDVGEPEPEPKYTEVHCTWCQRKGRRAKGHFYCHDCHIGLCEKCAKEHVREVTMNRHSVSVISKTYDVSPNQGPFPNVTQIGSIKLDQEISVRGSVFLPNGVLLLADFTNSKMRMFTGDYIRKHVTSLTFQKEKLAYFRGCRRHYFERHSSISANLDQEISVRGSAFLPNGVLLLADFTNSKIRMFTGDYTRKHVASLTLQKENKWDEDRPRPLDVADISSEAFAFTTSTGCVYLVNIGVSMLMKVERIITVIRFESNYGECLGLAYNSHDESLYVGCTSDREGTYFDIYGIDGVQKRTVRNTVTEVPQYLTFGTDKRKLYAADADSVTVYDVRDFDLVEQYTELQSQTRDILVDKYGYLYTLALERRTFKSPGSLYRLAPDKGVTKVTALSGKPSSVCYCARSDTLAVTFDLSRHVVLLKLVLRSYEKRYGNEIKPYERRK